MAGMNRTEQSLAALEKANHHRLAVAAERRRISDLPGSEGREALAELLELTSDPALLSGRVSHYLRAVRGIGTQQIARFLRTLGVIDSSKRVRDLTKRQRDLLIAELRRSR